MNNKIVIPFFCFFAGQIATFLFIHSAYQGISQPGALIIYIASTIGFVNWIIKLSNQTAKNQLRKPFRFKELFDNFQDMKDGNYCVVMKATKGKYYKALVENTEQSDNPVQYLIYELTPIPVLFSIERDSDSKVVIKVLSKVGTMPYDDWLTIDRAVTAKDRPISHDKQE